MMVVEFRRGRSSMAAQRGRNVGEAAMGEAVKSKKRATGEAAKIQQSQYTTASISAKWSRGRDRLRKGRASRRPCRRRNPTSVVCRQARYEQSGIYNL